MAQKRLEEHEPEVQEPAGISQQQSLTARQREKKFAKLMSHIRVPGDQWIEKDNLRKIFKA
jgi:hypothetical protein